MIAYVDTSTLFKLIVSEPGTSAAQEIWRSATHVVSVSLIEVEGFAALTRARTGGRVPASLFDDTRTLLRTLLGEIETVDVTTSLITAAVDITETYGLRGYDAVHLAAAAFVGVDVFSSADASLCDAASAVGFAVANPMQ